MVTVHRAQQSSSSSSRLHFWHFGSIADFTCKLGWEDSSVLCMKVCPGVKPPYVQIYIIVFHQAKTGFAGLPLSIRCRPDCANSAWVDAERRSFDWSFFSSFLEELDRLNSLEMVAKHREECRLRALPRESKDEYRASPLQIVNQLVAQKHLTIVDETNASKMTGALKVGILGD